MRRGDSRLLLGASVLSLIFALCTSSLWAQEKKIIRVSGAKYVYYSVMDLARPFMEKHPDLKVEVTAAEVDAALERVKNKTAHAVMAFGNLDDDQVQEAGNRGLNLARQVIAWGAVALIVDRNNPISALTVDQVKKIYLGEYTNWEQVGGPKEPIVIITRDEQMSGTEMFFRTAILDGFPFPQNSVRIHDHDIIRAVWKKKGALADARASEALRGQTRGMVKVLALKQDEDSPAVILSPENAQNNSYPISAPLVLYYDQQTNPLSTKVFVEFCARKTTGSALSELR